MEDRLAAGARARMERDFDLFGIRTEGRICADVHMDWLDESSLYKTTVGVRTSPISQNAVDVMETGVWGDVTLHWTDRFRTTIGLRADYLDGEVDTPVAANAGSDNGTQWSPKFNAAYQISDEHRRRRCCCRRHLAARRWLGRLAPRPLSRPRPADRGQLHPRALNHAGQRRHLQGPRQFQDRARHPQPARERWLHMVYFSESQFASESSPVEDIHFHPTHPRTFVLNLKAKY